MHPESEYTRAIRRAQHDGYAPFTVRPAIRGDLLDRAFDPIGMAFCIAAGIFVLLIGLRIAAWLLNH